jgi:hypothetical protein
MDEIRRMNELINISKMLPIMMRFNGELAKQSTLVIKIIEERKLKIATWNANGLLGKATVSWRSTPRTTYRCARRTSL